MKMPCYQVTFKKMFREMHGKRLVAPKRSCELPKEKPDFALGEIVKAAWQPPPPPPPPKLISRGAAWRRPVLKMPCEGHEKIRAFSLFLFALPECQGWVAWCSKDTVRRSCLEASTRKTWFDVGPKGLLFQRYRAKVMSRSFREKNQVCVGGRLRKKNQVLRWGTSLAGGPAHCFYILFALPECQGCVAKDLLF